MDCWSWGMVADKSYGSV